MDFLPVAFADMGAYSQFIIYKLELTANGKTTKIPCDYRTGQTADAHNPNNWTSVSFAIDAVKRFGSSYGVGFVFTEFDPFWFLDLDDCIVNGAWSETSIEAASLFNECAMEVSQSGKGLHFFGTGRIPEHSCKNKTYKMELYSHGRFVALTGNYARGNSGHDATAQMTGYIERYFPVDRTPAASTNEFWSTTPCEQSNPIPNDDELIKAALNAKPSAQAVFGDGAKFADLWEANDEVLAAAYPSKEDVYDRSQADSALASHLAFWTGANCERMSTLMKRSKLYRDKWDREDYLPRTIRHACGRQTRFFDNRRKDNETPATSQALISIPEQLEFFKNCVYVIDEHAIYDPNYSILLKPEQFNAIYGGHLFPLDHANSKTTRKAFEAFTESQVNRFTRVDTTCFRPAHAAGEIIERDGIKLVNIYRPLNIPMRQGDVSLFFDLLNRMIPNPVDQQIFLSFMAANVQHPGVKFTWAIVLQGVEGNGKSLLCSILANAIGMPYVHFPKADELTGKFNDWIYGKRLVVVEDIYVGGKKDVYERMKVIVTQPQQEIEPKGGRRVMREICANLIITTNHKDGIRKEKNNRRYCMIYTAQQSVDDLIADTMTGDYFPKFFHWLATGGQEAINYFLYHYPIPDIYNPATHCHRAPDTTTTADAVQHGYTPIQQEILEAVDEGRLGFRGGYISSVKLKELLKEINRDSLSPFKRGSYLEDLGYILHPGLKEGKATREVLPDAKRPRLYIHKDHPDAKLTEPSTITTRYEEAQRKNPAD